MNKRMTFSWIVRALLVTILIPGLATAGNYKINGGKTAFTILESSNNRLVVSGSISGFSSEEVNTPAGLYALLSIEGAGRRMVEGEPALPAFRKLVEVPVGAEFSVRIVRQHVTEIDLSDAGIHTPVFPAQPPLSKGDDPSSVPFVVNKEIYRANRFVSDEPATVTFIGTLRAMNLARIDLNPVQYNPVEKKLRIYDELVVEITYRNADLPATQELKRSKASPYFNSMYGMVENHRAGSLTDELITASPVTYVIVSDPMFQLTLQPFIEWKKKKGFKVIEGYTSNPAVGTTTTSIKAWLQGLYTNPPAGFNAPSFVLFVGDVAQIPAWAGTAGSHVTDLRYCEYTGDNLPEVYYGRFSATSTAQLQPQIDKTLEYEQYTMPDPSFLNEAVMVAGADASFQTHSNGQIYYGTENYFNAAHGILSHTYLQPEPSGANYSQNIKNNVSSGVSYANYTAHCSESGWANPSFVISDIAALTNAHKYCLMVGNCCLSCKFDVNSFAEEQLRAANKGSVGYIGGSNNTYWDEDYWWGCGFKTVVLHPAYDPNHIGAYDGTFHDHGEPTADWFVTQGQMVVCGNYAVEESGSSRKTYYWEIYHLMGDPSLMVYYSVPPALSATYQTPLMIGMTSLTVNTEAYAYIALSMNGTLLDAKIADATGAATLNFSALTLPGNADIVITKQNRQPHIGTIQVIPASGPYVVYTGNTISDPLPGGNNNGQMDFGETDLLNVTLKNVGVQAAPGVVATLSSTSPYVTLTDNTENYGNLDPNQSVTVNGAFSCNVANFVPDQTVIPFTVQAVSGTNSWSSSFNLTANAPVLQVGVMTVQDNGPGCDNDGILDPGETANLVIAVANTGHAAVTNVLAALTIVGGSSPYLTLNNTTSFVGSLINGGSGSATFNVTASASTPIGTPVDLNCNLTGGVTSQYSATAVKQVVIGLIPVYNMSTTTVTTCTGYFYDSGGPTAAYQNNENYTMTFLPATPGSAIRVTFEEFSTESGYDYLYIYNGINTSAPLIGTYQGTTSPGTVTATNSQGALTFRFTSDASVTPDGWAATVSCYSTQVPPVADFMGAPQNPQIAQTVVFSDLSTNMPTAWSWAIAPPTVTFADGTTSSSQNPHVQFNATGTYTVTLTATNAYGSDTEIKTNYISVNNCAITAFPWTEGFENGGVIPNCWSQEQVNNSGINWTFITGSGNSHPATAHSGTYNACLKDNSSADNKTRLITPALDLTNLPSPRLKFWHTQAFWSPDQDQLSVYYRTSPSGTWTLLNTYTANITAWTQETISLPAANSTYFIAFEGNAKYGYGVCVDDIEISSACSTLYPVSVSITASANPVMAGTPVTFTALPVNGGSAPVYQWSLNGSGIGDNSATCSLTPVNGDAVSCLLTSDLGCATGNPAASNTIVMQVQSVPSLLSVPSTVVTGTQCFDALQTITVAGDPSWFTVQPTGIATLIAGENIFFLPGTTVVPGGYLYGYIAPTGPFCQAPAKEVSIVSNTEKEQQPGPDMIRVFPNPVTDHVVISVAADATRYPVFIDMYTMKGEKRAGTVIAQDGQWVVRLGDWPSGLYIIRAMTKDTMHSFRIIKL